MRNVYNDIFNTCGEYLDSCSHKKSPCNMTICILKSTSISYPALVIYLRYV